jgi:transposase
MYRGRTKIMETAMKDTRFFINPLNAELNPIYYLLALLGAHHFLHISRIRVNKELGHHLPVTQLVSFFE